MEVKQNNFYSIVLTGEEASSLITAVESVYAKFASTGDLETIAPITKLKDEIILAANQGKI